VWQKSARKTRLKQQKQASKTSFLLLSHLLISLED
jgi:hypothetical protein